MDDGYGPNHPGIYQIRCRLDGKIYVGSAVNIRRRWRGHRYQLREGCHHSPRLQNAWNKYGADAFSFEVLRLVEGRDHLIQVEQEHLDRLQPWRREVGYNIYTRAESPRGTKLSAETRAKLSAARKNPSPETRAKLAEASRGRKWSPETRAKMMVILKGRRHTPESRAKLSAACKGRPGRPITPEMRAKLLAAQRSKKRTLSPKTRAALLAANLGRKLSPEHRAKISAARRGRKMGPMSEEQKAKLKVACSGWHHTPEARQKISESLRKNPHLKDRRRGTVTPERRARLAEANRRRQWTPEMRAKLAASVRRLAARRPGDGETQHVFDFGD